MRTKFILSIVASGFVVAFLPGLSSSADARTQRYSRDDDGGYYDRYGRYRDRDARYDSFRYRNNSYSARANNLDPAGDYRGYPDWARAALSPKFDGGNRR